MTILASTTVRTRSYQTHRLPEGLDFNVGYYAVFRFAGTLDEDLTRPIPFFGSAFTLAAGFFGTRLPEPLSAPLRLFRSASIRFTKFPLGCATSSLCTCRLLVFARLISFNATR